MQDEVFVNNNQSGGSNQKLVLKNRQKLTLTGVMNVESFSDSEIILITNFGKMTLKGKDFSITNVNVETGDFSMDGKVDSVFYSKKTRSDDDKLIKRLFK